MQRVRKIAWAMAAVLATSFSIPSAMAGTAYDLSTSGDWSTATNWTPSGGPPSTSADTGTINSGFTADASADLGTPGDQPTIIINSGGTLNQNFDGMTTPLTLNGGTLHITGFADTNGPINLTAASTIISEAQCCNTKSINSDLSGSGKLTLIRNANGGDRQIVLNGNSSSFTGGIEFEKTGALTLASVIVGNSNALGSSGTITVDAGITLEPGVPGNSVTINRDITLNGGTLLGADGQEIVNGVITIAADSTLLADRCCAGTSLQVGSLTGFAKTTVTANNGAVVQINGHSSVYEGLIDITNGQLNIEQSDSLGDKYAQLEIDPGAMLRYDSALLTNVSVGGLTVDGVSFAVGTYSLTGTYDSVDFATYFSSAADGATITVDAVPEPATFGLLASAGLLALSRRRRHA